MSWLADRGLALGTSGIRGPADGFDAALCSAVVHRFLSIAEGTPGALLIGHDLRASSPVIAAQCVAAAAGMRAVRFAGAVPTPALALASCQQDAPAVMITGSHIAGDRNGLKFFIAGREVSRDEERSIADSPAPADTPPAVEVPPADPGVAAGYVRRYVDAFGTSALSGLKIAVVEQSSAGRDILHEVLRGLGAESVGLGRSSDFAALDTEALPEALCEQIRSWAHAERFDAIVAADGDADRPLVADERGSWLRGDRLGLLAALACAARTVATPITSSSAIEASEAFDAVIRTRIGSPHVVAAMAKEGLPAPVVGFEANGGFLLGSDLRHEGRTLAALRTRDAVLPIVLVLAMARKKGVALSALSDGLPQRHTASGLIGAVPREHSTALIDVLRRDAAHAEAMLAGGRCRITAVDDMDGLRCRFEGGAVVHLRASGNAPELRCYAEAGSSEEAGRLVSACLESVGRAIRSAPPLPGEGVGPGSAR